MWGGAHGFEEFRLDRAKEVAAAAMPRRGREFTPAVAAMFDFLAERTRPHRTEDTTDHHEFASTYRIPT